MYLKTNRCSILLTEEESCFLKERILKEKVSIDNVKKGLSELYYNSSKRYFSIRHINEISQNLYKDILLEYPGRNLRNNDNMSGNNSGVISDKDILNRKDIVNADIGVCTNSGSDIVTLHFKTKENKIIYFDSPDQAENFIKNLRYKNL